MGEIKLRALTPDDWEILREIRLRAVKAYPNYFSTSVEDTENFPPEHWKETVSKPNQQVFGLFDDDRIIGITAIFPEKTDTTGLIGNLAFTYIDPDYRGRGLTDLYYKARIEWALENTKWKTITTGHREGNEPSRRTILRNGFVYTHSQIENWPDGTTAPCLEYELDLESLRKI